MMKYEYDSSVDLNHMSVQEAIEALQTWQSEHPDAVDDSISLYSDGEGAYCEINFSRPMTELEIQESTQREAEYAKYLEKRDVEEYERLKAKFEGN